MTQRQVVGKAERLVQEYKRSSSPSPQLITALYSIKKQLMQMPLKDKVKTLINEITIALNSKQTANIISSELIHNHGINQVPYGAVERIGMVVKLSGFFNDFQFHHTFQKESRGGEFTTINGVNEKIGNNPVLSQIRRDNPKFERAIDTNNLQLNIGFSPPCKEGDGLFIIRKDIGLDQVGRPSKFEYWCFCINSSAQKELCTEVVNIMLKELRLTINESSQISPGRDSYSQIETGGEYIYNDFNLFYKELQNVFHCMNSIPNDNWLHRRSWYWYYPELEPSHSIQNPSSSIYDLLQSQYDFQFGNWKDFAIAVNNVNLHRWISARDMSNQNVIKYWIDVIGKDGFICSVLSNTNAVNFEKLALIIVFENLSPYLSLRTLDTINTWLIDSRNEQKFEQYVSNNLLQILSEMESQSVGIGAEEFLRRNLDFTSDNMLNQLLNRNSLNNEVIEMINRQIALNSYEEILSKLLDEKSNLAKELHQQEQILSGKQHLQSKIASMVDMRDKIIQQINIIEHRLTELRGYFAILKNEPDFVEHVKRNYSKLDSGIKKELSDLIKKGKGGWFAKKSALQQIQNRAKIRSTFYFAHLNWLHSSKARTEITKLNQALTRFREDAKEKHITIQEISNNHPNLKSSLSKLKTEVQNQSNALIYKKREIEKHKKIKSNR